ncbi:MAG: FkbM family methyltransferase [Crocinitomicaceae bacterium]|nr:FkbM family methyltransferase [Crocinitomicaceae bacterium]
MKKVIKKTLDTLGVVLLKKSFLPTGISMEADLSRHIDSNEIKNIFDIGANIGTMSRMFNDQFTNATVYSFEPVPATFQLLKENTSHYHRIKPYNVGFSSAPGRHRVYLQRDNGLNSVNDQVNKPDENMNGTFVDIELLKVDDFCRQNGIERINILKTDTEGWDIEILKGSERLMRERKIDFVFSEVGFYEDNVRNTSFEELRKYLSGFGFRLRGFYDQSTFGNVQYLTCANALFALQK